MTPDLDTVLAAQDGDDAALQRMIDAGAWSFEGSMGRAMMRAIEDGRCVLGPNPAFDYWGNRIPSRFEVEPGTKGSVEYAAERTGRPMTDPKTAPLSVYVIQTESGLRCWYAENVDHAIEQHNDAFEGDPGETILGVAIAIKASSEYPGVKVPS